jgi:ankyrin repeat protein
VPPTGRRKSNGHTPLHDAAKDGRADLMQLLTAHPDVNALNNAGESPLRLAVNAFLISGVTAAKEGIALLRSAGGKSIPALGPLECIRLRLKGG